MLRNRFSLGLSSISTGLKKTNLVVVVRIAWSNFYTKSGRKLLERLATSIFVSESISESSIFINVAREQRILKVQYKFYCTLSTITENVSILRTTPFCLFFCLFSRRIIVGCQPDSVLQIYHPFWYSWFLDKSSESAVLLVKCKHVKNSRSVN